MKYIKRQLERKFLSLNSVFKAILLTGARQVGKSTMLKHLANKHKRNYVSMDDIQNRELAQSDPKLFFQMFKPPIIIDEIQKAPELFDYIKIICDETDQKGLFWLTGSESRKLLKKAGDSLSGRVCILQLMGFSQSEKLEISDKKDLDFSYDNLIERQNNRPTNNIRDIFFHIWLGGLPEVQKLNEEQREAYFDSYIETYLIRDAVDDNGITDTIGFRKILRACSAFVGQLLNYNDLAVASGVSSPTAKEWVKVLQKMGIIYLLEPFYNNELKRLVKTPKLYFCDTGLGVYLSRWLTPDALMQGAASGAFFENYVVMELIKHYSYSKNKANISFYRDVNQKEIDIVLEEGEFLHSFEIKKSASPDKKIIKSFNVLDKTTLKRGFGGIICMTDKPFPLDEKNNLIPCNII